MAFKSGFISIIGRPNVGKSTLMNNLIGEKIAIMSDKPQTTRNKIHAVYTNEEEEVQMVFLDTPGIHEPKNKLGEFMVKEAKSSFRDVDVILYVVDESKSIGKGDSFIIESLRSAKVDIILIINKIDKLSDEDLFKLIKKYDNLNLFKEIIPTSALNGKNTSRVLKVLKDYLKQGPMYFPSNMITDQPERVLISELIREKVLRYTEKEVPHGIAVEIEKIKKRKEKDIIDVSAIIYCERNSHKGIIIGKNGRKLKGIGKSAREDIEALFNTKVNLQVWVKVKENWRDKSNFIKNFGYESK